MTWLCGSRGVLRCSGDSGEANPYNLMSSRVEHLQLQGVWAGFNWVASRNLVLCGVHGPSWLGWAISGLFMD
ncbi:hypothetical protein NDU88_007348 [Pleurodeles waltl]|uniref:Uncharacterized protein n=1 Tax=Pleurodeles waltl TaxID=8319 RepID=A0AAV7PNJ5_PLEWA|nr:hypothetical protein NDU88_007348 [Pleurodeles waltl]